MVIEATVPATTAEAIKLGLSNEGLQVPVDLSEPFWGGNTLFIKCRVQVKSRPTNQNHRIISVFVSLVGESDEEDDEEREANRESEELEEDVEDGLMEEADGLEVWDE